MKSLILALVVAAPTVFARPILSEIGPGEVVEPVAGQSLKSVLDFSDAFIAQYGNELKGVTTDGKACALTFWDKTSCNSSYEYKNGKGHCKGVWRREAYVSLGTSATDKQTEGASTYVGFWINPGPVYSGKYQVNQMDVSPAGIHINITHDEVDAKDVENDLLIKLDANGKVTEARGTSSYWPSSTCLFK